MPHSTCFSSAFLLSAAGVPVSPCSRCGSHPTTGQEIHLHHFLDFSVISSYSGQTRHLNLTPQILSTQKPDVLSWREKRIPLCSTNSKLAAVKRAKLTSRPRVISGHSNPSAIQLPSYSTLKAFPRQWRLGFDLLSVSTSLQSQGWIN
ncbi:uncharacterized protein LOC144577156 isoform X2 [Callithrix jacchus]